MKITFYQAECGDATRIEFTGGDGQVHNIFFDMGFERTYRSVLQSEIKSMAEAGGTIDLVIVSHIHDDHIGGAIAYLKAVQFSAVRNIVTQWLYNPPRGSSYKETTPLREISAAKSIVQGDFLAGYLDAIGQLPTVDYTNELRQISIFGLTLTLLSPNKNSLEKLRLKYPAGKNNPFEREELLEISHPKSATINDYDTSLLNFTMGNMEEDSSVENGSSIAALLEHDGKKILCLGDAFPSVVIAALKKMGYSSDNPLVCDWVKVAHHGSAGNNTAELYQMISCDNFLISANGKNKCNLPAKKCIATIVRNRKVTAPTCHIYFTYDNAVLRNIFSVDVNEIFEQLNFKGHYLNNPANVFEL